MRSVFSLSKKAILSHFVVGLCLVFLPITGSFAKSGCCSKHGGVASCDVSSGFDKCKDGTQSPSCKCDNNTTSAATTATTTTKSKPTKKTTTSTSTTAPASAETTTDNSAASTSVSTATTTTTTKTKGCCARHGGVASCDKASGYDMCKDGTKSSTCTC